MVARKKGRKTEKPKEPKKDLVSEKKELVKVEKPKSDPSALETPLELPVMRPPARRVFRVAPGQAIILNGNLLPEGTEIKFSDLADGQAALDRLIEKGVVK
jgi:hypothetical protein